MNMNVSALDAPSRDPADYPRHAGFTLDRPFVGGAYGERRRMADAHAERLAAEGFVTHVSEEPDTEAVYVWRRG